MRVLFPNRGVSIAATTARSAWARARLRPGSAVPGVDRDCAKRERQVPGSGQLPRTSDRPVPRDHVALAAGDEPPARPRLVGVPDRSKPPLQTLGSRSLAHAGCGYASPCAPSALPRRVALHPPLRGVVARSEPALLRRPADGRLVPAALRAPALRAEGHGRSLDAARADLGGGEGPPERPRLQPLAEHGPSLRRALNRVGGSRPPASGASGA